MLGEGEYLISYIFVLVFTPVQYFFCMLCYIVGLGAFFSSSPLHKHLTFLVKSLLFFSQDNNNMLAPISCSQKHFPQFCFFIGFLFICGQCSKNCQSSGPWLELTYGLYWAFSGQTRLMQYFGKIYGLWFRIVILWTGILASLPNSFLCAQACVTSRQLMVVREGLQKKRQIVHL